MNVLFVCIGNQGRSVLAERLFRAAAGPGQNARSAGAAPGAATHPEVLEVLRELGIDASDHVPTKLDDALLEWADVVVATCDGACRSRPANAGSTGTCAIRWASRWQRCGRFATRFAIVSPSSSKSSSG